MLVLIERSTGFEHRTCTIGSRREAGVFGWERDGRERGVKNGLLL